MNIIFFLLIFILLLYSYSYSQKNVFSPDVVICAVFLASSLFVVLNTKNWNYFISVDALLYIITALLLTLFGIFLGKKVNFRTKEYEKNIDVSTLQVISFNKLWILITNLLCVFILYRYFKHQYNTSVRLGNTAGIPGMILTLRMYVYDEDVFKLGTFLNIGISFLRACGYIALFSLIDSIIIKKQIEWKCIIPVCTLLLYFILTTGRGAFIGFICAFLYDIYFSLKRKGSIPKPRKMIRYMVFVFICFLILFWQLGKLTGKDNALNVWDTFSIYIGSSILCFDKYQQGYHNYNFTGMNTFRGIAGILAKFGLNVKQLSNHVDKIRWETYSSNVYTAFYSYYDDFGPFFSLIIIFIVGFIIGMFWRQYQLHNNNLFSGVLYGRFIAGAVAMYSIAEKMISNIIALNALVEIFFIIIIIRKCSSSIKFKESKKTFIFKYAFRIQC